MNCAESVDQLPEALAVAVRLHDAGYADPVLATALGVPVQSIPGMRRLAYAKLARIDAGRGPGTGHRPVPGDVGP